MGLDDRDYIREKYKESRKLCNKRWSNGFEKEKYSKIKHNNFHYDSQDLIFEYNDLQNMKKNKFDRKIVIKSIIIIMIVAIIYLVFYFYNVGVNIY